MSQASNPASEVHARRAANIFIDQAFAVTPDRKLLMEASMRAAVALEITKLGLAHALSRPMGIATGESHDMFNLMLGAPVMRYWGDDVIQRSALAKDVALDPVANLWIELLDHYQRSAGLPDTLAETALAWEDVERAAETATQSTGIPLLPRPLADGDLLRIATDAWSGASR
jgi:alcohol dehydrogenase class IV